MLDAKYLTLNCKCFLLITINELILLIIISYQLISFIIFNYVGRSFHGGIYHEGRESCEGGARFSSIIKKKQWENK